MEAALTAELSEDGPGFIYRLLGERLQRIKEQKDASDEATAKRLRELEELQDETAKAEPERLKLTGPGEYGIFTVLRATAKTKDASLLADCARRMVAHLRAHQLLAPGWSASKGGRQHVEDSLLTESWNPPYAALGFDASDEHPAFLAPAIEELAQADEAG